MKFDSTFLRERHFCGPNKWRASNCLDNSVLKDLKSIRCIRHFLVVTTLGTFDITLSSNPPHLTAMNLEFAI